VNNRKEFLNELAQTLNYSSMEDWYKLKGKDLHEHGGGGLAEIYGNSPFKLLQDTFSEYPWKSWKFYRVPDGFWQNESNLRRHFDDVGTLLSKTKETWERTSAYSLHLYKGKSITATWGSFQKALQIAYPNVSWKFSSSSIGQQYLRELVEEILKPLQVQRCIAILENYKHPDLLHTESNRPIELDIYIPSLELAFEYQGIQHEKQIHRGDVRRQIQRDKEKKELCSKHGISLICIPHQWSGLAQDLIATICHHRPQFAHFFSNIIEGNVIELVPNKPKLDRTSSSHIPFMLPTVYQPLMDPTNW
jgi:hypothetical protein